MNHAQLKNGKLFYINGRQSRQVPKEEQEKVLAMLRYQQIDMYLNRCEETSCKIVEGRVYDISGGERL